MIALPYEFTVADASPYLGASSGHTMRLKWPESGHPSSAHPHGDYPVRRYPDRGRLRALSIAEAMSSARRRNGHAGMSTGRIVRSPRHTLVQVRAP